jgi:hypothetical protein
VLKKLAKALGYLLLTLIGLTLLGYFSLTSYVNYKLEQRTEYQTYDSCQKVWSARGLYQKEVENGVMENSIESVALAFARGGSGVEIDVRYDPELKKFFVTHDYPYIPQNGKLLTLKEMFDAVGGDGNGHFWLDYKNVRWLNREQTQEAVARLLEITAKGNLRERVYVEASDPINLPRYREAGLNTIFDVHPPKDALPITSFVMNIYKVAFYFGGHSVMGMAHGSVAEPNYGPDTRQSLGNIPVFLYHVPNDTELLKSLIARKQVRVTLVGRDISVGRFELDLCPQISGKSSD